MSDWFTERIRCFLGIPDGSNNLENLKVMVTIFIIVAFLLSILFMHIVGWLLDSGIIK